MSMKALSAVLIFVFTVAATATASPRFFPPNTDLILLPLAFKSDVSVRGANATMWTGSVFVHNASADPVPLRTECVNGGFLCEPALPPGFTGEYARVPDDPDGGLLLTVSSQYASAITFSNRILETSRHAQPQGFQVPVVHTKDFVTGETNLLALPTVGVRTALRLYDPLGTGNAHQMTFAITAVSDDGTALGTITLTTTFRPVADSLDPYRPGFAAIYDVAAAMPSVVTVPRYHLRIKPLGANADDAYWAMGSVTDNDTQQVLLVTPQ